MASQLATNSDTAAFGQQLVSGSVRSFIAVAGILQAEGGDLPTLTQDLMQNVQQLVSVAGGQFDAQFANFMVTEQLQSIANFQNELQNGTDPQVIAYAMMTLPGLQQQLQTATALQSEYGGGGGG